MTRRNLLPRPTAEANVHLFFTRFLPDTAGADEWKRDFVREVVGLHPARTPLYAAMHDRWASTLKASGAYVFEAETLTPTIVGLGEEHALETSLTLHFTYGVPIIPGSALKGLASHYAHQHLEESDWQIGGRWHRRAFGTLAQEPGEAGEDDEGTDDHIRGEVTFHTALARPGQLKLRPEVMTVHHKDYYMTRTAPPPAADWDMPVPIPFISTHGSYTLALGCDDPELAKAVYTVLQFALQDVGIGAKTSSGFGRMKITTDPFAAPVMPAALEGALNGVRAAKGRKDIRNGQLLDNRITVLLKALQAPEAEGFQVQVLAELWAFLDTLMTRQAQQHEFGNRTWWTTLRDTWGGRP